MTDILDAEEPHENWVLRHTFMASCFIVASAALISFIPPTDVKNSEPVITQSSPVQTIVAEYAP